MAYIENYYALGLSLEPKLEINPGGNVAVQEVKWHVALFLLLVDYPSDN